MDALESANLSTVGTRPVAVPLAELATTETPRQQHMMTAEPPALPPKTPLSPPTTPTIKPSGVWRAPSTIHSEEQHYSSHSFSNFEHDFAGARAHHG